MNARDFFNVDKSPKWDVIGSLPEFKAMFGCEQSKRWHLEGDVWEHTALVVENMVKFLRDDEILEVYDIDDWHADALLMAALYHDVGKPVVTKWNEDKQDWTSRGHAEEGAFLTRMCLYDWYDVEQREYIVSLVRNHMIMHDLLKGDPTERLKRFRWHFFDNTNVMYHHQCLLCMCDDYGSMNREACFAERMDTQKKIRNLIPSKWTCMIEKNDNEIEVYVLIGLPGSGKSSWAAINYPDLPRVSRDDARAELGLCGKGEKYLGTREEEDKVTRYCENKILDIVGSGSGVIIDNTHLKQAYREKIHDLLKNFKVKYIYVYVEAPSLDENIRRREKDGFGSKSSEIILKMLKGFEFPYGYEYDDLIIVKQLDEN